MVAAANHDALSRFLIEALPRHLPAWLPRQRWYGGKARAIDAVAVRDVVWLPAAADAVAVVVVDVGYAPASSGGADRCALLLGVVAGPGEGAIARAPGPAPDDRWVRDVASDPDAVVALLAGLVHAPAAVGVHGGTLMYADTSLDARQMLAAAAPPAVRTLGAEQSNTSVRVGAAHVFKLLRRLDAGEHPQLEMGRFLALAGFHGVPRLEGSLVYRAADGQESALGVLENWIHNDGDGWRHLLARLDACRRDSHVRADLYADLVALGDTTAAFHAALAADTPLEAFAPEAATAADVALWHHDAAAQTERTLALLRQRLATLTPDDAALAEVILDAGHGVARRAPSGGAPGFDRIRIHGDFHLGQTLKIPGGFTLIDFEGEPSKPLAARRQKQCALKDVAGLLRSLDYAAATDSANAGAAEAAPPAAMRAAFLEGYYAHADGGSARFLPASVAARATWTGFFELEKALYEVEYELNNRPTWASIPLRAVARLAGSAA